MAASISFILVMLILGVTLGMVMSTGLNMAQAGQLSYEDQSALPGLEGGLADTGFVSIHSRTPGANVTQQSTLTMTVGIAAVAQVEKITVTTAADADVFNVNINGVLVATGTSSGTDKTVQRDALQALLIANAYFAANFTWADSSTDAGTITAIHPGQGFSIELTIDTTSVWTPSNVTPNTVGTYIRLTINGVEYDYPCASTTEATELDALEAILVANASLTNAVAVTNPSGTTLVFTAIKAGVPFSISLSNSNPAGAPGSGTISLATGTANVTGAPVSFGRVLTRTTTAGQAVLPSATGFILEGISLNRAHGQPKDGDVTGVALWEAGEVVPTLRRGVVFVIPETTGLLTASVYVRHTQGATADLTVGRVRATDDNAKVDAYTATQGLRWLDVPTAGKLCRLEINLS